MAVDRFVLDASVALAWFLPAKEPDWLYAQAVFDLIVANRAVCAVPSLFDLEMGSVLLARRRFKDARFTAAKLERALLRLDQLKLEVHHQPHTYRELVELAQRYQLQGYDAVYFHLAESLDLPIATLDGGQREACKTFKVQLLEP